jgi:hypothetical protein
LTTTTENYVKVNGSNSGRVAESSQLYIEPPFAIKPAYIVLAGLGGGCILLVIIGVIVICTYPLKRDPSNGVKKEKVKKEKKEKVKHKNSGELHTRRPKTLSEEEEIGMNTMPSNGYNAAAEATTASTYDKHNSYNDTMEKRNSVSSNNNSGVVNPDPSGDHDSYAHGGNEDTYNKSQRDSDPYNKSQRDSDPYNKSQRDSNPYNKSQHESDPYNKSQRDSYVNTDERPTSYSNDDKHSEADQHSNAEENNEYNSAHDNAAYDNNENYD